MPVRRKDPKKSARDHQSGPDVHWRRTYSSSSQFELLPDLPITVWRLLCSHHAKFTCNEDVSIGRYWKDQGPLSVVSGNTKSGHREGKN